MKGQDGEIIEFPNLVRIHSSKKDRGGNSSGGGIYDMDNMLIVTPKFHKEILDPKYHFGRGQHYVR